MLRVQVVPGASRRRVLGANVDVLRVALTSPPERGRANRELLDLLASELGVPARSVVLLRGATARLKQVRVETGGRDEAVALADRAHRWAAKRP